MPALLNPVSNAVLDWNYDVRHFTNIAFYSKTTSSDIMRKVVLQTLQKKFQTQYVLKCVFVRSCALTHEDCVISMNLIQQEFFS